MEIMRTYLVIIGVASLLTGCSKSSSPASKTYFVAFSQCNNAEPYRSAQNELLSRICSKKPDIKLTITDAQQDNSKQIAQIETLILQKPDLLIVAPNERAPLTAVMGKALAAGIPTICLERDIAEPNYTTYIACDNANRSDRGTRPRRRLPHIRRRAASTKHRSFKARCETLKRSSIDEAERVSMSGGVYCEHAKASV